MRENHLQRKLLAAHLHRAGVLDSDVVALNLFGGVLMYRACEIFTEFGERCGATVLPVTSSAPLDKAWEIGSRFKINTLMGSSSRLLALARYVEEEGLELRCGRMIFAGEPMSEGMERYLRSVFEVNEIFGLYGSAETGVWAWSRSPSLDLYTVPRDLLYPEEVEGTLVATNLVRYRYPVLRYEMGDRGGVEETDFGFEIRLEGREERTFSLSGRLFELSEVAVLAKEALDYQVVLGSGDRLTLRVAGLNHNECLEVERKLQQMVGGNATVELIAADKMERAEGSDKVIRFIQSSGNCSPND